MKSAKTPLNKVQTRLPVASCFLYELNRIKPPKYFQASYLLWIFGAGKNCSPNINFVFLGGRAVTIQVKNKKKGNPGTSKFDIKNVRYTFNPLLFSSNFLFQRFQEFLLVSHPQTSLNQLKQSLKRFQEFLLVSYPQTSLNQLRQSLKWHRTKRKSVTIPFPKTCSKSHVYVFHTQQVLLIKHLSYYPIPITPFTIQSSVQRT